MGHKMNFLLNFLQQENVSASLSMDMVCLQGDYFSYFTTCARVTATGIITESNGQCLCWWVNLVATDSNVEDNNYHRIACIGKPLAKPVVSPVQSLDSEARIKPKNNLECRAPLQST